MEKYVLVTIVYYVVVTKILLFKCILRENYNDLGDFITLLDCSSFTPICLGFGKLHKLCTFTPPGVTVCLMIA